jgi:hypothetical protein
METQKYFTMQKLYNLQKKSAKKKPKSFKISIILRQKKKNYGNSII